MNWEKAEQKNLLHTYKRQPVVFVKGKGKYLWDVAGKKYIDFFCGISVTNLGHVNPAIVKVIKSQAGKLIHCSNHYYMPEQIKLAEALASRSFGKNNTKMFLSNSGAEANECAIKLAFKYGTENSEIISFTDSFHGRTLATLIATGQEKFRKGYEHVVNGFRYAEFNNIESVKKLVNNKTCAVIIEPVQGEGGINIAGKQFLMELRQLCDEHKLLLIFDEIQCGMGRTGELFAYQYYGVEPDIITMAKSIANGLPLGVTLVKGKYACLFNYGDHGSTFGGNIVSCAAAVKTLSLLDKKMLNKIKLLGAYFSEKLNELKLQYPKIIKESRGVGLMCAIELAVPGDPVLKKCLKKGIIINCTQEKILRFLPPFVIEKQDIDILINTLSGIFKNMQK